MVRLSLLMYLSKGHIHKCKDEICVCVGVCVRASKRETKCYKMQSNVTSNVVLSSEM